MVGNSGRNSFDKLVRLKYDLYNGLFLTLPFPFLEEVGIKLPLFAERCRLLLKEGRSPKEIVESFSRDILKTECVEKRMDVLFLFTQFIERQVVLFDALEQAAFAATRMTSPEGRLASLLGRVDGRSLKSLSCKNIEEYRTRIVLTAHPTQFYPEALLAIIDEFAVALGENDLFAIEEILLQLGMTSFRNVEAPTPLSEADNLLKRAGVVFYEALLAIEKELNGAFGSSRPPHPMVELGFWPGGDRDGNPNVDAATTVAVAGRLKECALARYRGEIAALKRRLTFPGMLERLSEIEGKLESYDAPESLLADIEKIKRRVIDNHRALFVEEVERFALAVRTFGFHFASLDLRQDSSIHGEVVAALLKRLAPERGWKGESLRYAELRGGEKLSLLEEICSGPAEPFYEPGEELHPLAGDLFGSLRAVKAIQGRNGEVGLHRYIISNTQGAHNVAEILFLLQLLNLTDLAVDIVPLFETVEDLKNAEKAMELLYKSPLYRGHLKGRKMRQVVMVGFSDGTKDGGYLTCNWEIFKAKRALEALSEACGVKILFFDGRGGPPARGGGNTHKFYRSLGASLAQREVQLTIQGQTISSKFGTVESALYNIEQIFTAGLESHLLGEKRDPFSEGEEELLNTLSGRSYAAYMELRNDPLFLPFLQEITPLNYYGKLNVASRPVARGGKRELNLKDLRAIPFVGAWSQVKLNVPGFYGLGTALESAFSEGRGEEIKRLYRERLFFTTLINNAMQSLAKSEPLFTKYLLSDRLFGPFAAKLHGEVELSRRYLLEVSGERSLMESEAVAKESIAMREKVLLPLVVIQQYALKELKECREEALQKSFEKLVIKTLPSITNASRNSA